MKRTMLVALLLCGATPVYAQDTLTSTSGSGAEANSGSVSGAQSNNDNVNAQVGNIGVSENTNTSNSSSGAISGSNSESISGSNSDQQQGQSMGQDQGQSQNQGQSQDQALDSSQANQQGVTVNQTWNTKNRKTTEIRTNNAVPLTSSSSFSSDYCGGSVSGGVSAAPLGISVGGAGTKFDKSCQSLRRAEKFGMAAVNAANMGQLELSGKLMSMMIWSICTSDSSGPDVEKSTADACNQLLLLGSVQNRVAQPAPGETPNPRIARNGKITPEAAHRALAQNNATAQNAVQAEQVAASKPPR